MNSLDFTRRPFLEAIVSRVFLSTSSCMLLINWMFNSSTKHDTIALMLSIEV